MRTGASILSLHPSICEKNGIKLNHSIRKVCFQLNHESEMETPRTTHKQAFLFFIPHINTPTMTNPFQFFLFWLFWYL